MSLIWAHDRRKAAQARHMIGLVCLLLVTGFAIIKYCGTAAAGNDLFIDFPVLIHCETSGTHRAFYLSTIGPDGVAVYASPDRMAGTITVTGVAVAVGGDWSGSCSGKTLDELRSAGQAFDLPR